MWLLPTRDRPLQIQRFFKQALATGMSTPGRLIVGPEDFEKHYGVYTAVLNGIPKNLGWDIRIVDAENIGDSVEPQWRLIPKTHKWFGQLSDDIMPVTDNWDSELIKGLKGNTHMVSANDNWQAPTRFGAALVMTREIVEAVGYLFPEGVKHMYQDDVYEIIGRETKTWECRMDVIVEHWHADRVGLGVRDDTYHKTNTLARWNESKAGFDKWKQTDMGDAIERVRRILSSGENRRDSADGECRSSAYSDTVLENSPT